MDSNLQETDARMSIKQLLKTVMNHLKQKIDPSRIYLAKLKGMQLHFTKRNNKKKLKIKKRGIETRTMKNHVMKKERREKRRRRKKRRKRSKNLWTRRKKRKRQKNRKRNKRILILNKCNSEKRVFMCYVRNQRKAFKSFQFNYCFLSNIIY